MRKSRFLETLPLPPLTDSIRCARVHFDRRWWKWHAFAGLVRQQGAATLPVPDLDSSIRENAATSACAAHQHWSPSQKHFRRKRIWLFTDPAISTPKIPNSSPRDNSAFASASYPQMLAEILGADKLTFAVAGEHTANRRGFTAMVGEIMTAGNFDPTMICGATPIALRQRWPFRPWSTYRGSRGLRISRTFFVA